MSYPPMGVTRIIVLLLCHSMNGRLVGVVRVHVLFALLRIHPLGETGRGPVLLVCKDHLNGPQTYFSNKVQLDLLPLRLPVLLLRLHPLLVESLQLDEHGVDVRLITLHAD